ncbi:MAG: hypothetical protein DMG04_13615 [Acidobacteria bacterium]|nr:MAG: hypothetical protein DMG04_13615 [Acidobacteriota bacterium]
MPVRDRVDRVDLRRGHGRPPERFSAPWTGTFVLLGTVRARSRPAPPMGPVVVAIGMRGASAASQFVDAQHSAGRWRI